MWKRKIQIQGGGEVKVCRRWKGGVDCEIKYALFRRNRPVRDISSMNLGLVLISPHTLLYHSQLLLEKEKCLVYTSFCTCKVVGLLQAYHQEAAYYKHVEKCTGAREKSCTCEGIIIFFWLAIPYDWDDHYILAIDMTETIKVYQINHEASKFMANVFGHMFARAAEYMSCTLS